MYLQKLAIYPNWFEKHVIYNVTTSIECKYSATVRGFLYNESDLWLSQRYSPLSVVLSNKLLQRKINPLPKARPPVINDMSQIINFQNSSKADKHENGRGDRILWSTWIKPQETGQHNCYCQLVSPRPALKTCSVVNRWSAYSRDAWYFDWWWKDAIVKSRFWSLVTSQPLSSLIVLAVRMVILD